jgi:hypothetical protein
MEDTSRTPNHPKEQILLPGFLAERDLSLEEIGAISCFLAVLTTETDLSHPRFRSPGMERAFAKLRSRGIVSVAQSGEKVSISVDLKRTAPYSTSALSSHDD